MIEGNYSGYAGTDECQKWIGGSACQLLGYHTVGMNADF